MEKNKPIFVMWQKQNLYCTNETLSFDKTAVPTAEGGSTANFRSKIAI